MQTSKARRVLWDVLLPASILDFKPRLGNRCRKAVAQRQRGQRPIPIFLAAKKNGPLAAAVAATIFRVRFKFSLRQQRMVSPADRRRKVRAASILDFKPRLGNHCRFLPGNDLQRAAILDFKPRLGNRCKDCPETPSLLQ